MTQETNPRTPKTLSLTPHPQGGVNAQSAGAGRPSRPLAIWELRPGYTGTWDLEGVCLDYAEAADILGCTKGYISALLAQAPSFTKWEYRVTRATMQQCLKHLPHAAEAPSKPAPRTLEITVDTSKAVLQLEDIANTTRVQKINELTLCNTRQCKTIGAQATEVQRLKQDAVDLAAQGMATEGQLADARREITTLQDEVERQDRAMDELQLATARQAPPSPLPVSLTALKALGDTLAERTTQHSPTTRKALDAYLLSLLKGMGLTLEAETAQDPTPATPTLGSIRCSHPWGGSVDITSDLTMGRWYVVQCLDEDGDYIITDDAGDNRCISQKHVDTLGPTT